MLFKLDNIGILCTHDEIDKKEQCFELFHLNSNCIIINYTLLYNLTQTNTNIIQIIHDQYLTLS